jgi:hypothetical protein
MPQHHDNIFHVGVLFFNTHSKTIIGEIWSMENGQSMYIL